MAKSVEKIKAGLKLRTQAKEGVLSLRLGTKKYVLPFEARLIQSDEYLFLHLPPSAEILRVDGRDLILVESADEAEKAVSTFRKGRRRTGGRTKKEKVEISDELKNALQNIPNGFKLAYGRDGSLRLVKTRNRGKKA
ncbi:MAG: hypothetical protein MUC92_02600 [Fimbriimonadaceae bacterium]|jgi:hypothetical protein|nr:hypothetical protein [Fimbriimonadaceae bacterium]